MIFYILRKPLILVAILNTFIHTKLLQLVHANALVDIFKNRPGIFNKILSVNENNEDIKEKDNDRRPFDAMLLKRYISSRTKKVEYIHDSGDNCSIWCYEGRLIDPYTNRFIADVEGIEFTRHISDIDQSNKEEQMNKIKNLAIHNVLLQSKNWDYTGIIQSRKLFCYRDKSSILKSIQLRPGIGKKRRLKPKEQIKCYDTILSFVSCNRGNDLIIVSEWDDGRILISNALAGTTVRDSASFYGNKQEESLDYTIFSRMPCRNRKDLIIPSILTSNHTVTNKSQDDGTVSPPRSQLIQIGPSSKSASSTSFGSRETYHYTFPLQNLNQKIPKTIQKENPQSSPTLRYTRFGECPPWAGFGKMCTLELIANSIPSLSSSTNKVLTSNMLSKISNTNNKIPNNDQHQNLPHPLSPNSNINEWREESKLFQSSVHDFMQREDEKDRIQKYNHRYYATLNNLGNNLSYVWDKFRNAVTIHHNM